MRQSSRGEEPTTLADAQCKQYWEKGFVAVRRVLDQEDIEALRDECARLWSLSERFDRLAKPRKTHDGGEVRDRIDPLGDHSPMFQDLARDERLLAIAHDLLGVDACLFKDKLIFKPPGTTGYLLHQDYTRYAFTKVPADDILSITVVIDPATIESGTLEFFSGYHHDILPEPSDDPYAADPAFVDLSLGEVVELEAGDVVAFHSATPHRSAANMSDRPRRVAHLTYSHGRHGELYGTYYAGRAATFR